SHRRFVRESFLRALRLFICKPTIRRQLRYPLRAQLEVELTAAADSVLLEPTPPRAPESSTDSSPSASVQCPGRSPAFSPTTIGDPKPPSSWHSRVFRACAGFLGLLVLAVVVSALPSSVWTASAFSSFFLSGGVNDTCFDCSDQEVDQLNAFFAEQRRILATDQPAFEDVPVRPSMVSDSAYFGSLENIKINPELQPEQQRQLRSLCREFQDIFFTTHSALTSD
ncbi:MAG: hypothetical protein AAF394_16230, partial [Planctomycetota bacterium]